MDTMVQYLYDISKLEGQIYTQNWILSSLKRRAGALGIHQSYEKPEWYPWKPEFVEPIFSSVIAVLSWIIKFFKAFFSGSSIFVAPLLSAIKLFCIIFILENIIYNIARYREHTKEYIPEYKKRLADYNASVKADSTRVQHELQLKQLLMKQINQVEREKSTTTKTLQSLYSIGIIHPKYRNMIAVSSFYDYFDTGRCFVLTGPGGAYATYEEDLRFKIIETKLDVIISKLDQIIYNQKMIATLMQDANSTLHRIEQANRKMMSSMSRIEENSELTAYNTRCSMQSNAVLENIMVYHTLKQQ